MSEDTEKAQNDTNNGQQNLEMPEATNSYIQFLTEQVTKAVNATLSTAQTTLEVASRNVLGDRFTEGFRKDMADNIMRLALGHLGANILQQRNFPLEPMDPARAYLGAPPAMSRISASHSELDKIMVETMRMQKSHVEPESQEFNEQDRTTNTPSNTSETNSPTQQALGIRDALAKAAKEAISTTLRYGLGITPEHQSEIWEAINKHVVIPLSPPSPIQNPTMGFAQPQFLMDGRAPMRESENNREFLNFLVSMSARHALENALNASAEFGWVQPESLVDRLVPPSAQESKPRNKNTDNEIRYEEFANELANLLTKNILLKTTTLDNGTAAVDRPSRKSSEDDFIAVDALSDSTESIIAIDSSGNSLASSGVIVRDDQSDFSDGELIDREDDNSVVALSESSISNKDDPSDKTREDELRALISQFVKENNIPIEEASKLTAVVKSLQDDVDKFLIHLPLKSAKEFEKERNELLYELTQEPDKPSALTIATSVAVAFPAARALQQVLSKHIPYLQGENGEQFFVTTAIVLGTGISHGISALNTKIQQQAQNPGLTGSAARFAQEVSTQIANTAEQTINAAQNALYEASKKVLGEENTRSARSEIADMAEQGEAYFFRKGFDLMDKLKHQIENEVNKMTAEIQQAMDPQRNGRSALLFETTLRTIKMGVGYKAIADLFSQDKNPLTPMPVEPHHIAAPLDEQLKEHLDVDSKLPKDVLLTSIQSDTESKQSEFLTSVFTAVYKDKNDSHPISTTLESWINEWKDDSNTNESIEDCVTRKIPLAKRLEAERKRAATAEAKTSTQDKPLIGKSSGRKAG